MPMMPLICDARYCSGASSTFHGFGSLPSSSPVRSSTWRLSQAVILDDSRRAPGVHRHVVPGRHDFAVLLLGRVQGGRDVKLRSLEHDQGFVDRGELRHCGLPRAMWARSVPCS